MQTICTDRQCLRNYLLTIFNEKKNTSQFNEKFMKNYDQTTDVEYIFEVDVQCSKELRRLPNDAHQVRSFYQKEGKLKIS